TVPSARTRMAGLDTREAPRAATHTQSGMGRGPSRSQVEKIIAEARTARQTPHRLRTGVAKERPRRRRLDDALCGLSPQSGPPPDRPSSPAKLTQPQHVLHVEQSGLLRAQPARCPQRSLRVRSPARSFHADLHALAAPRD